MKKENKKYVIALDAGTTSVRTVIVNKKGEMIAQEQQEFTQYFPKSGWVEHNAIEIWNAQRTTLTSVINNSKIDPNEIDSIGITNQRETIVVWHKETGMPIYNAIVWQDRRTTDYCEKLNKTPSYVKMIKEKTGLLINPYFSGTKLKWILDNVEGAREDAKKGKLLAGTIESWLIYRLTNGKVHVTDKTNASRTLLMNIKTGKWDNDLLKLFDIPVEILPEIKSNSEFFGKTFSGLINKDNKLEIPITGAIGDQQSALFGQLCTHVGEVKNTYGTGCFALINIGEKIIYSKHNLLTTVALDLKGKTTYALEGSISIAGAAIQWLRDSMRLIYSSSEVEWYTNLALKDKSNQRIYFVPSFVGLGAPYWDDYSRGAIFGIERGTKREHIIKATVESLAYQSNDLIQAMRKDLNKPIKVIKVDGGACKNNYLMQFQADVSQIDISRPSNVETTAMGAAFLAGLATGFWKNIDELKKIHSNSTHFLPKMPKAEVENLLKGWDSAVGRTSGWLKSIKK